VHATDLHPIFDIHVVLFFSALHSISIAVIDGHGGTVVLVFQSSSIVSPLNLSVRDIHIRQLSKFLPFLRPVTVWVRYSEGPLFRGFIITDPRNNGPSK